MSVIRLQQKSYQLEDRVMGGYAVAYRAYLARRDLHRQSIELLGDRDLAREPRIRSNVDCGIEHVLFLGRALAGLGEPGFVDIDVAGGTSA